MIRDDPEQAFKPQRNEPEWRKPMPFDDPSKPRLDTDEFINGCREIGFGENSLHADVFDLYRV